MKDKLKPCPFCGGEGASVKAPLSHERYAYYIECLECGANSDLYGTEEKAIKAWNTRKPMDRIVEQLKAELYRGMESLEPVRVAFNFGINRAIEIVKAV